MFHLLTLKFKDPYLRDKLLRTGEARLIEGNWWKDRFWGQVNGVGENHLGRLLTLVRYHLQHPELEVM